MADLKTPEGVEKAARESLGLVLPGENVYVVVPSDPASQSSDVPADASPPDSSGILTALLDAVFGVSK